MLDHRRNRSAAALKPSFGAAGSALAAVYHEIMRFDPYRSYKGRPAAKPAVKSAPPKPTPPPAEPPEPAKESGGEKQAGK